MVIRCERCSRLYELDETLLSPAGSEVQCTKCQHVFTAHPPRSAGRTLVGMPVAPDAPAEPVRTASSAWHREPPAPDAARSEPTPSRGQHDAPGARVTRPVPPPVYHPSGPTPVVRSPVLRRDTVGAFEARLRWHARWKWLGPSLAAALVILAVAGVIALRRRGDVTKSAARVEALALVALDDSASIEAGMARLDQELSRAARDPKVAGDRALAQVVRAAGIVEEGEVLAARLAARSSERERLRRDQPGGWEEAERAAAADARALEGQIRAHEVKARELCGSALETLRALQRTASDSTEVLRGLAAYYALGGERERALAAVQSARERGSVDGWIDLAEAWTEARHPERDARERALVKLGAVAAAYPELLRARFLLARTQATLGRRGEALATIEGLLAANPRHEGAKRFRAELVSARSSPGVNQVAASRNPDAQQPAPPVSGAGPAAGQGVPPAGRSVTPSGTAPTSPPSATATGTGTGALPATGAQTTRTTPSPSDAPVGSTPGGGQTTRASPSPAVAPAAPPQAGGYPGAATGQRQRGQQPDASRPSGEAGLTGSTSRDGG